ncbi:MAG: biotin/lipoyl-containing protein, partial [Haloarcula sp.]
MSYIVKMPKLGLEMEQGTVLEWTVEQGDEVSEGEMIAEVESEKSIGEVEAREDGTLRRVYAEEGDAVPPGTPIGIFAAPDADIAD